MRYLAINTLAALFLLMGNIVSAETDFSKGSKARAWNLSEEEKALFSGQIVDVICHLSGDCPANCGRGKRYLGVVRQADDKLIYILKNAQAAFSGPVVDLLPYCNKKVDVDGLLVGSEELSPVKLYMVQRIRAAGAEKWSKANKWTKNWNKNNPDLKKVKGSWFRKDPRVLSAIEADGYLGLGQKIDEKFKEYLFE